MRNNHKFIRMILVLAAFFVFAAGVFAQDEEGKEESILKQFPVPKYTFRFFLKTKHLYYRFPYNVPTFDPLDLKYFPHETWNETDWGLLARYEDSYTYRQTLMLRDPAETWVFHGTPIGEEFGFLDDFYLYTTLFVSDSYPDQDGSCYVYYSDSLVKGFDSSMGILVDPQTGIFQVDNIYDSPYNLTNKSHDLNIVQPLNADDFPIDEDNIASSSYYGKDFIYDLMDEQFVNDWNSVKNEFHFPGSTVRAYRIELVREGTNLRVYINGKLAGSLDDGVTEYDEEGNVIPARVSWSYGPVLYTEGETVTCSIGAMYINGRERTEANDEE